MPSVVGAIRKSRLKASRVRLRSIVPGRQRWEVGVVLGRPGAAELLEARLRESPGVERVRANPVTGRLLVCHDTALSGADIGRRVQDAVAMVLRRVATRVAGAPGAKRGVVSTQRAHRRPGALALIMAGGAVGAVAASRLLRRSSLARVGGIVLASGVIIWRAWRRSRRSHQDFTAAVSTTRHPLLRIVGPRKRRFYLASLLSVLGQLLEMAPALFLGWILVMLTDGPSATLVSLGLTSATGQLWFLAGTTALLFAAAAALSFISAMIWRDLAQSVQHEWRTQTYTQVQRAQLRHLEDARTTRLTRTLTEDVNQLGRFFATSANDLLQTGTGFLVLIPVFLIFAPSISWIALLPIPIISWLSFHHHDRATRDYATNSENGSLLTSQLANNLEASPTVKSFSAETYEINRIQQLSQAYQRSNHQVDTRTTAYIRTVRLCTMLSMAGFLLGGGLGVLTGTLGFGVFNALIGLPNLVLWKLPALGEAVDQYQQTVNALERVLALHRLPVEELEAGQDLDVETVTGEIVLDNVTFAYEKRPPVLHRLSLKITANKTTGIVGVTGAGKTTIAKLLLRLQDVDSGQVLLDGHDIREMKLQDLRTAISFVAQDAFLFDGTVTDNITYGSFDAGRAQVERAARLVQADGFVQALPAQYDTMIGERGVTLSGGQKQRLSLARAIVKNSPILILDEATSAVDNETEMAIHHALTDFAKNRTLVIIAHRLSTIRHADRIYVLGHGGTVLETGTHQELLARKGMYASLWNLQIGEQSA